MPGASRAENNLQLFVKYFRDQQDKKQSQDTSQDTQTGELKLILMMVQTTGEPSIWTNLCNSLS